MQRLMMPTFPGCLPRRRASPLLDRYQTIPFGACKERVRKRNGGEPNWRPRAGRICGPFSRMWHVAWYLCVCLYGTRVSCAKMNRSRCRFSGQARVESRKLVLAGPRSGMRKTFAPVVKYMNCAAVMRHLVKLAWPLVIVRFSCVQLSWRC